MLTASERYALLEQAEELHQQRRFSQLTLLLEPISVDDQLAEPMLAVLLGTALALSGRCDVALEILDQITDRTTDHTDPLMGMRIRNLAGMVAFDRGEFGGAEDHWRELLQSAIRLGNERFKAAASMNLGNILSLRGHYDDALASYQRALQFAVAGGDRSAFSECHQNLGMCYRHLGLYHTADASFEAASCFARECGSMADLAGSLIERALLKGFQEDFRVAEILAAEGMRIGEEQKIVPVQGEALRVIGTLRVLQQQWESALAPLERALKLASWPPSKLLQAEVLEQLALAHRATGARSTATEYATESARLFSEMGAALHQRRLMESFELGQR